jgi:hypothetical protein
MSTRTPRYLISALMTAKTPQRRAEMVAAIGKEYGTGFAQSLLGEAEMREAGRMLERQQREIVGTRRRRTR